MSDKSEEVLRLHDEGLSDYQIAKRLKTSTSYVAYIRNPDHPQRQLRRERMKRIVREKVSIILSEEPDYRHELRGMAND